MVGMVSPTRDEPAFGSKWNRYDENGTRLQIEGSSQIVAMFWLALSGSLENRLSSLVIGKSILPGHFSKMTSKISRRSKFSVVFAFCIPGKYINTKHTL